MNYKFFDPDDLRQLHDTMQDAVKKIDSIIDSLARFGQDDICGYLNDAKDSILDEKQKVDLALNDVNRQEEQEELNAYYKQCY